MEAGMALPTGGEKKRCVSTYKEDDALCARLAEAGYHNAARFTAARFTERLTAAYDTVMTPAP